MSKIKTYLGFSIKSKQIVIGYNNLEKLKKGAYLIIMENSIGESTYKKVIKISQRLNCQVLTCDNLFEYLGKTCKIVALTNQSLASAIITNADQNFTLIPKEGN